MLNALIVDDEYLIREGLKVMLDWGRLGVEIDFEASNGSKALDIIVREKPHIAILDIKMPVLDGIQLIKAVREAGLDTLFIILSGYDNFDFAQQALKFGAFRYLLKPVEANELEQCISDAVKIVKTKHKEEDTINKCRTILGEKIFGGLYTVESEKRVLINGKEIKNSLLVKVIQYIHEHISEELTLEKLAKVIFINPSYLSKVFKNEIGDNLADYIPRARVEKAKELLKSGDIKSYEAGEMVGYNDSRYFSQVFKKYTGCSPSEFKKQQRKQLIN